MRHSVRATLLVLFIDIGSKSSSIDLCREILFSVSKAGHAYIKNSVELVAIHFKTCLRGI